MNAATHGNSIHMQLNISMRIFSLLQKKICHGSKQLWMTMGLIFMGVCKLQIDGTSTAEIQGSRISLMEIQVRFDSTYPYGKYGRILPANLHMYNPQQNTVACMWMGFYKCHPQAADFFMQKLTCGAIFYVNFCSQNEHGFVADFTQ